MWSQSNLSVPQVQLGDSFFVPINSSLYPRRRGGIVFDFLYLKIRLILIVVPVSSATERAHHFVG